MSQQKVRLDGVCEFGAFRPDPDERLLSRDGLTVALTPKAFDVLVALVSRACYLVKKEDLLKEVWPDTFVEEANLSYTVSLLRKALGEETAVSATSTPFRSLGSGSRCRCGRSPRSAMPSVRPRPTHLRAPRRRRPAQE